MTVKSLNIDTTLPIDGEENRPPKAAFRANWSEIKAKYETLAGQAWRDRGEWDDSTAYLAGDVVYEGDAHYRAESDNTGQQPSESPATWRLIAGASTPGGGVDTASDWGSDFGLPQDNATDIAPALNDLMDVRQASGIHVTRYRPNPSLPDPIIASAVKVPSGHTFDRSNARFQRKRRGRIGALGKLVELPETGKYRLAQNISAGDTTIFLRVPVGGSIAALQAAETAGMDLVIRGENDAAGEVGPDDRETVGFTIVDDTNDQNIEILLSTPAVNSYLVEYEDSEWPGETGSGDFTLASVTVGSPLTMAAVRDQNSVTVASIPSGLVKGSSVMVRSDELVPSGTSTLPYGEERHRVRDIAGLQVFFERQLSRDFPLEQNPKLLLVDAVKKARIVCGHQPDLVIEVPLAAPASRTDHYVFDYADDCELIDPWVDDRYSTHSFRGASIMARRSYNCRVVNVRAFRPDGNGPGDRNQLGSFYSGGTAFEGFYLVGGRHGCIAQGGYSPTWRDGYAVGCNTNALDTHGCGTVGATFDGIQCLASTALSTDSANSIGATIGNTSHRAPDVDTAIRNCTFVGYRAGDGTGVMVRAPSQRTSIIGNSFVNSDNGIVARIDSRAGPISIVGVTLQANTFANCNVNTDQSINEAPAWASGVAVAGTALRPIFATNANKLYSTPDTGTTGAIAPTHTSGTAGDGGVSWTYIETSANRIVGFVNRDALLGDGGSSGQWVDILGKPSGLITDTVTDVVDAPSVIPASMAWGMVVDGVRQQRTLRLTANGDDVSHTLPLLPQGSRFRFVIDGGNDADVRLVVERISFIEVGASWANDTNGGGGTSIVTLDEADTLNIFAGDTFFVADVGAPVIARDSSTVFRVEGELGTGSGNVTVQTRAATINGLRQYTVPQPDGQDVFFEILVKERNDDSLSRYASDILEGLLAWRIKRVTGNHTLGEDDLGDVLLLMNGGNLTVPAAFAPYDGAQFTVVRNGASVTLATDGTLGDVFVKKPSASYTLGEDNSRVNGIYDAADGKWRLSGEL